MSDDDTISVRQITEVRTCAINGEPETVVLAVKCGSEVIHYMLPTEDLARLGEQLQADAMLLTEGD